MEWLADPTAWLGLLTLIVLELVLGIDNLVFIAILADKLPPEQRDRARLIGLSLALLMRLGLLASISWLVTLTQPLFEVFDKSFSGRDLIMLFGGVFLLFKATMELHERLEGHVAQRTGNAAYAMFWPIVAQIVVLDAVFSLDAVITAVGMVDELAVMMIAVIVSIGVMIVASKPLTRFVNAHPTVIMLCLGFLMMIGFALTAEGLGFHIPKGYLYAAIGFSILIELFNQIARARRKKSAQGVLPVRERTAHAVMRLLGGRSLAVEEVSDEVADLLGGPDAAQGPVFDRRERVMISGVVVLGHHVFDLVVLGQRVVVAIEHRELHGAIFDGRVLLELAHPVLHELALEAVDRRADLVGLAVGGQGDAAGEEGEGRSGGEGRTKFHDEHPIYCCSQSVIHCLALIICLSNENLISQTLSLKMLK